MRHIVHILLLVALVLVGCTRHRPSEKPPIHPNPNMDDQPRYDPQAPSEFFADGKAMRQPVAGTVARGRLNADPEFYTGKNADGDFIRVAPVTIDLELLKRGQERYDIFCGPCHSRVGDGKGIMIQRGYVPPPSFYDQRLVDTTDGYLFDVITHGIRNMPGYQYQIPVPDRWAIVAYMRALQRSKNATIEDVPLERRETLRQQ
ncbi:cytochrome c [candidate division GN15 bacterium]|nr:cytochrome c [candidate division GN15 bacterium]